MCCGNNRSRSLFVGWLNIVLSVLVAIYLILPYIISGSIYYGAYFNVSILYSACPLVLWLIFSILLVKGIKQNRPKLMAPWILFIYVVIILSFPFMVTVFHAMSQLGGGWQIGLYYCLFVVVVQGILIVCVLTVRKQYRELSIAPPVLPTQCITQAKQPEVHQRYIPVFDN